MSSLELSLLENAYDFLESALDHLRRTDEPTKRIKYAILHLSSSVELLLKYYLHEQDWKLIFEDSDKANLILLESGKFKSVTLITAFERLKNMGIDLEKKYPALTTLKSEYRNKIEHYRFSFTEDEVMSVMTKVWGFIVDFKAKYIEEVEFEDGEEVFDRIKQKMGQVEDLVDRRLSDIGKKLESIKKKEIVLIACPKCFQPTLPLAFDEDYKTQCEFCRSSFDGFELEDIWLDTFDQSWSSKDDLTGVDRQSCPDCGDDNFHRIHEGHTNPPANYLCFSCGSHWAQLEQCSRCGNLYSGYPFDKEDIGFCSDCIDSWSDRE